MLRAKLGLLRIEDEPYQEGLMRISQDQLRRTTERREAQIKLSPKLKKEPKPKVSKPRKKRERKLKKVA